MDSSIETDTDEQVQPMWDYPVIASSPAQVLDGMQIGLPELRAPCTSCHEPLTEGQVCIVSAARPAAERAWYPVRCYCRPCAPAAIPTPTVGTSELLVQTRLGVVARPRDRRHRLCLLDSESLAFSPPTEGRQP